MKKKVCWRDIHNICQMLFAQVSVDEQLEDKILSALRSAFNEKEEEIYSFYPFIKDTFIRDDFPFI
jgi:hypothetical protein